MTRHMTWDEIKGLADRHRVYDAQTLQAEADATLAEHLQAEADQQAERTSFAVKVECIGMGLLLGVILAVAVMS